MSKVLIINEPFVKDFCRTQRWAARTRGRVLRAPDWLAYAAAVLEQAGAEVKLYDFPAMDWGKEKLAEIVKQEKPDFVVLDATTPSIYSDIDCARIVKENSQAKVIMVGPHVSALPEETLKEAEGKVDAVCVGEYDWTVRDIVRSYPDLSKVPGIAYINEGARSDERRTINSAITGEGGLVVIRTQPRKFIENLDELPFPAWHHLDLMKYFDGGKLYPYIDIISGRGCPSQCSFCLWPQAVHGNRYRLRSPENVVDEIEYDIKLCPQVLKGGEFFFEDDTFTVNKKRAMGICEEILARGLKITFSVNARADTYDIEMFRMMKKAGCRAVLAGFESGNQQILDNVSKHLKLEQSREFVKVAHEARLDVLGCFVMGLPGETRETMEETLKFALSLDTDFIQFSGAVPFPGTSYFVHCKKNNLIKAKKWDDWLNDGEQGTVISYPGLTKKDIDHYVDLGLKKFYFRPSFIIRFILKTRSKADLYRKLRGGLNFFSYLFDKLTK